MYNSRMQSNVAVTAILVSGFTIGFKLVTCREFGLVNSNFILVRWFQTNFFFKYLCFFSVPKEKKEHMFSRMRRENVIKNDALLLLSNMFIDR